MKVKNHLLELTITFNINITVNINGSNNIMIKSLTQKDSVETSVNNNDMSKSSTRKERERAIATKTIGNKQ